MGCTDKPTESDGVSTADANVISADSQGRSWGVLQVEALDNSFPP